MDLPDCHRTGTDHRLRPQWRMTTRRAGPLPRRHGMGMLGLFGLLGDAGYLGTAARAADLTGRPDRRSITRWRRGRRTFPRRAKHVIHIYLNGGPSQVDTFDPKPLLKKYEGKMLPQGNLTTERQDRAPRCRRRSGSRSTARAASRSARSSRGRPSTSTTSA